MNEAAINPTFPPSHFPTWAIVLIVLIVACCCCLGSLGLLVAFGDALLSEFR